MIDLNAITGSFPRRVPIFPLPDSVLFPGAVLPLHVFEPRYRRMLADALAGDRLLAMALLKPCAPEEYRTKPPFHETVCVGCVLHAERMPNGRSNIAVLGVAAGTAGEPADDLPYRTAEVALLDERGPAGNLRPLLEEVYGRIFPGGGVADLASQLAGILPGERIDAAVVNTCAMTSPLRPFDKLRLLREEDAGRRLERLLELLDRPWQWN
jgi:Lon protease-like protein